MRDGSPAGQISQIEALGQVLAVRGQRSSAQQHPAAVTASRVVVAPWSPQAAPSARPLLPASTAPATRAAISGFWERHAARIGQREPQRQPLAVAQDADTSLFNRSRISGGGRLPTPLEPMSGTGGQVAARLMAVLTAMSAGRAGSPAPRTSSGVEF